jgi:hypothetical protein
MDLKYKHFHQERVFAARATWSLKRCARSVRTFMAETLEWRAMRVAFLVTTSLEGI